MWYSDLKSGIEAWTGLDKDALHIHAAILLYLAVSLVRRRAGIVPWLIVLAVEIANEALDLRDQYQAGINIGWGEAFDAGWPAAAKDLWNTMIWPTVFLLLGPWLVRRAGAPLFTSPEQPLNRGGPPRRDE